MEKEIEILEEQFNEAKKELNTVLKHYNEVRKQLILKRLLQKMKERQGE